VARGRPGSPPGPTGPHCRGVALGNRVRSEYTRGKHVPTPLEEDIPSVRSSLIHVGTQAGPTGRDGAVPIREQTVTLPTTAGSDVSSHRFISTS
jgi:hypothetical protein